MTKSLTSSHSLWPHGIAENDSKSPADRKRDTVAPRCIHDSGSAVEQMSAEIYCDYVGTQRDNRQNNILCMILQHKLVLDVNLWIERLWIANHQVGRFCKTSIWGDFELCGSMQNTYCREKIQVMVKHTSINAVYSQIRIVLCAFKSCK